MNRNKKKQKDTNEKCAGCEKDVSIYKLILSSSVCAAIIAGVFSMVTVHNTNKITKEIEIMKYEYYLHQETYEELREALNYFARFKVFNAEFINHFEYSGDESFDFVFEMSDVSGEEFDARIKCLVPYLSEEAKAVLIENGILEFELQTYKVDKSKVVDYKSASQECRKYFDSVNEEYERFSQKIIKAIEYDIKTKYIPE